MADAELETFKREIDLRAYAASKGFVQDRKESSRGTSVMRHPISDEKVIVTRSTDAHYLWFSVRSGAGGTIMDFVHYLRAGTCVGRMDIGSIRMELRSWIGKSRFAIPSFQPLQATRKDRVKVDRAVARMHDARAGHSYLEKERALPSSLFKLDRFAGRILAQSCDAAAYPNAIFLHFDGTGLCGYEIKNVDFTGFAAGGTKATWLSHEFLDDTRLLIAESAIDALSHAVLFPDDRTRYASIGGKPNPQQPELIRAAIARMPADGEVVAAMDADEDGARLNEVVRKAFELSGRLDLKFRLDIPAGYKDWNDQLRKCPLAQFAQCQKGPSLT